MFMSVNTDITEIRYLLYTVRLMIHYMCRRIVYKTSIIMPQYIHSDSVHSIHNEHITQLSGSLKPWSVLRLTISRSLFLRSFALLVPLLRPYFLPTLVDFDGDTDGASGTFNDWNGTKQSSHAYVIVNCIRSLCCRVYNELDLCSY